MAPIRTVTKDNLYDEEMLVVYNDLTSSDDEEYICVGKYINYEGSTFRYRMDWQVHVLKNEYGSRHFIKVKLAPSQFVILCYRNVKID